MTLSKVKLGEYIERVERRNSDLVYDIEDVRGISNNKEIQPTKANVSDRSFDKFQILEPKEFVFNRRTTRMGDRLGLGYNDSDRSYIFTEDYVTFRVKDEKILNPDYLYIFFRRPEFDRYVRYDSWGSATEFFNWEEMCDVPINLPPIEIQQKYVDVYNAMVLNLKSYEQGLEDLGLVIALSLEKFKHSSTRIPVGDIVDIIDIRNNNRKIENVQGINIEKTFMPSVANLSNTDLSKYKVISKDQFAYSAMQTGRDRCIRIALFQEDAPVIISPAYSVLYIKNKDVLPEYFMLWFSRKESDRYGWFVSDGSVRASLELPRFYEIEIPVPSLEEQKSVINLFKYRYSVQSNIDQIKKTTKDLCPILIKGSIEEAQKSEAVL
jgi:type I restriction enzyme S subunit